MEQFKNIPNEMQDAENWLLWRLKDRGRSKPAKVPYSANGGPGKVNDPNTWGTFGETCKAFKSGSYSGIGFAFSDTPYVAVDIDGCIDLDTGEISPEALDIVERLDSYTEYSQSGQGLHIICKGILPSGRRRNGPFEMYGAGSNRYFAMTGKIFGAPRQIRECQEDIDYIHQEYCPLSRKKEGKMA